MMPSRLGKEIGKTGPFASLEEEVLLNILRAADRLTGSVEHALKPARLSPTQYNVLRILRGPSPQGLACQEIARRMITRDADLTRLLDRLQSRGLVHRQRQSDDRRVVLITITPSGLALLSDLDQTMYDLSKKMFIHMSADRLKSLLVLIEQARKPMEP